MSHRSKWMMLGTALIFALAACGSGNSGTTSSTGDTTTSSSTTTTTGTGGHGGASSSSSSSTTSTSSSGSGGGTGGTGGATSSSSSTSGAGGGVGLGEPCGDSANGAVCQGDLACCTKSTHPPFTDFTCTTPCEIGTPGCGLTGCPLSP